MGHIGDLVGLPFFSLSWLVYHLLFVLGTYTPMNFLSTGHVTKAEGEDAEKIKSEEIADTIVSEDKSVSVQPNKSAFVDKITMEYMMNRNHYKRYLAKTNTTMYQEVQEKIQNVRTCSDDIKEMVNTLLEDYTAHGAFTKYNTDVIQSFEEFMTICMRYIQENPKDESDQEDSDVLFGASKKIRKSHPYK
jgi:hypothetical protein